MSLMARKALAYDSPAYGNAYITTPITTKSMFSVSKFCMKYEFGNTDTVRYRGILQYRYTNTVPTFKNTDTDLKYRYRPSSNVGTQIKFNFRIRTK